MKALISIFVIVFAATLSFGQAPTLRIQADDGPNLPADLYYGNTKVKPLRLRPGTNIPITINDSDFFVSTQYTDFLSRFPDPSGFNFWIGGIENCTPKPGCTELSRIHASAAFFLSIEFKETGFVVYKMYKAAFNDLPGKPVPVRRQPFMADTRTIGNGVIVNQQGWQQVLENNKNSFALAFVQRPEFQAAYPAGMTADEFVNQLDNNAGKVLSDSEKANLVSILAGDAANPTKRASVVRSIAENSDLFSQQQKNKAFVLMQYFGYLRRNPDEGQDTNFDGYNFWLNKLNQFNGDFIQAEMVRSFLVSGEYQNRF